MTELVKAVSRARGCDTPPGRPGDDTPLIDAAPRTARDAAGPRPGSVLGGYRLEAVLGAGGMGTVFRATDPGLGRQVAVKTLKPELASDPNARGRFLREARATAAIANDHVIPVYAVGQDGDTPYLVMPLLRGEGLNARLERDAWPTLAETCRIGRELAAGLSAAHAAGLVHRDVKPSNVWLDEATGRAMLLDFGLARLARGGDGLTRAGVVVGTPEYMAPEQAAGGAVDGRTDLFALGVVLYELVTGRRPFVGDSVMAILTGIAVHHPPPAHELNANVPLVLSLLIGRLLAKSADERPATAADVAAALGAIEGLAAAPARPVAPDPEPSPPTLVPAPVEPDADPGVGVAGWAAGGLAVGSAAAGLAGLAPAVTGWAALVGFAAALTLGLLAVRRAAPAGKRRGRLAVGLAAVGLVLSAVVACL